MLATRGRIGCQRAADAGKIFAASGQFCPVIVGFRGWKTRLNLLSLALKVITHVSAMICYGLAPIVAEARNSEKRNAVGEK